MKYILLLLLGCSSVETDNEFEAQDLRAQIHEEMVKENKPKLDNKLRNRSPK